MLSVTALAISLLVTAAAPEDVETATFDGVTYTRQFVSNSDNSSLAEYVRPGETVDNWTTLLAVHSFPHLDDPDVAAAQLVKTLKKTNPEARFQLLVKEDGTEAMVDFLTWITHPAYCEFNVFRYLALPDRPGLVAYQFAYRFSDLSPKSQEQFKQDRVRWLDAMTRAEFPDE